MKNKSIDNDFISAPTVIALLIGIAVGYRLEMILNWMVGG